MLFRSATQYAIEHDYPIGRGYAVEEIPTPESSQRFSGQWRVTNGAGRELYRFGGVGNNQADANRRASAWARENNYSGSLDVLPVMI